MSIALRRLSYAVQLTPRSTAGIVEFSRNNTEERHAVLRPRTATADREALFSGLKGCERVTAGKK